MEVTPFKKSFLPNCFEIRCFSGFNKKEFVT